MSSELRISDPTRCHLWSAKLTKRMLFESFTTIKTYLDDYHNTKQLKQCRICLHFYYYEFREEVDHMEGEDREYYSFTPVDDVGTADKLSEMSRYELAGLLGIFMNFPPHDSKPYWHNR